MRGVIRRVPKCNIRFFKPHFKVDSITGLRTFLKSQVYPIKRNKNLPVHQWVCLTFLWVSFLNLLFRKGPKFRHMQHLPFWFLVACKHSSSPKSIVYILSWGRASWHCLCCHMVVVTAAYLSAQGSHPVVSCVLSVHCSANPEFVVKFALYTGEASFTFKF